ncbi:MAG: short-chain dehydrogenase, partial [Pleurocapsa sp.]
GKNGINLPDNIVTDPAQVMAKAIQGIQRNKLHVFPDRTGNSIRLLKQYFPKLLDVISDRLG